MAEIMLSHTGETAYESSSREFGGQAKAGERLSVQERGDPLNPVANLPVAGARPALLPM